MKILFVITGLGLGGAEKQVLSIANRLSLLDNEVTIVYLTGENRVSINNPWRFNIIPLNTTKSPLALASALLKLRGIIEQIKPDIVHSHMVHANIFCRILRLFCRIPILICTAHNINEGGRLRMLAYRITDCMCDITTNVSVEAVAEFVKLKAAPKSKILCLPNGIEVDKFQENNSSRIKVRNENCVSDKYLILTIGRLVDAKDHKNLLYALSTVLEAIPKLELWIVGDGPLETEIRQLASELGLTPYIRFMGSRDDVPDLLNAADLFVLSSAWEGFGLVVAEAMLTERFVVATDCGGVSEVLSHYGLLVPPRNSSELAKAILRAFRLPEEDSSSIRKKARKHILNNFDLDVIVSRWIKLYRNLTK